MASADSIKRVVDIIKSDDTRRYIVVSAPGKRFDGDEKITDLLYALYRSKDDFGEIYAKIESRFLSLKQELDLHLDIDRELDELATRIFKGVSEDFVVSRGEYLSAKILAEVLGAEFVDAKDTVVFSDDGTVNAEITVSKLKSALSDDLVVLPGFYGSLKGDIKTFSRGGSDISGAIVAAAVRADVYENWTDVDGVYSANPKTDKNARLIERMTYKEMFDLSAKGANVLHKDAVYPVERAGIPINVRNTFNPMCEGTYIT